MPPISKARPQLAKWLKKRRKPVINCKSTYIAQHIKRMSLML